MTNRELRFRLAAQPGQAEVRCSPDSEVGFDNYFPGTLLIEYDAEGSISDVRLTK